MTSVVGTGGRGDLSAGTRRRGKRLTWRRAGQRLPVAFGRLGVCSGGCREQIPKGAFRPPGWPGCPHSCLGPRQQLLPKTAPRPADPQAPQGTDCTAEKHPASGGGKGPSRGPVIGLKPHRCLVTHRPSSRRHHPLGIAPFLPPPRPRPEAPEQWSSTWVRTRRARADGHPSGFSELKCGFSSQRRQQDTRRP